TRSKPETTSSSPSVSPIYFALGPSASAHINNQSALRRDFAYVRCLPSAFLTARGAPPPRALARRLRASLGPQALSLLPFTFYLLPLSCYPPSIDEERCARHVRRRIGREIDDRSGQLVELTPSAHRNLRDELLVLHRIFQKGSVHLCGKRPGTDGVGRHTCA